ncbi:MAG: hypothetical protein A2Y12_04835 [Planctomycetes bacterium GWF2_42_9]|nr:MAG: hypothetical protein A2Y12_04835 [Planctomycetes bacterium GWF2_42_9]
MFMQPVDWVIVACLGLFVLILAFRTQKYTRSVADFLSANRCAGRYMLATAENMAMVGAISILATFQMYYYGGLGSVWWSLIFMPVGLFLCMVGWVIYRFRETRAMTLAQFFEIRYSRSFRIFIAIIIVATGIVNFGVFPAIGARFFVNFCGFDESLKIAGLLIPSFPLVMIVLLLISLCFAVLGGQIAIMVTDFVQGIFSNFVFLLVVVYLIKYFGWTQISEALSQMPENQSMINPFKGGRIDSFNVWFFMMWLFMVVYGSMAWQGSQGFNSAAINAHEAKMGKILGNWRANTQTVLWVMLALCAFTLMHHSNFSAQAGPVNSLLNGVENEKVRSQLIVPMALANVLPPGLFGALVAAMFAGFISVHQTYMHSWASIFIQDIYLPLKKQPLTPKQHLRVLRLSILGVTIFILIWSLVFKQTEYIMMYMQMTGAIYLGGAGAVIIGGLYWKRGTTAAAWSATITGCILATTGIVIRQMNPEFPLDGMKISFITALISLSVYLLVSLLCLGGTFDLDKMLHRGKYAIEKGAEPEVSKKAEAGRKSKWVHVLSRLGLSEEFNKKDRLIWFSSFAWGAFWSVVFVLGTIYNILFDVPDHIWLKFWYFWILLGISLCILVTAWLTWGGILDMKKMYFMLDKMKRDVSDDGRVQDEHQNFLQEANKS